MTQSKPEFCDHCGEDFEPHDRASRCKLCDWVIHTSCIDEHNSLEHTD